MNNTNQITGLDGDSLTQLRLAYLSSLVALMAQRYHLDRMDTTACVLLAATQLAMGSTAGSAYDHARQLAAKLARERAQRKVVYLIDRIKAATPALQAS
jgi:hypothetical protein